MFIVSMKMTKGKLFLGLMVSIITIVGALTLIGNSMASSVESAHGGATAVAAETDDDLLIFVETLGWQVDINSRSDKVVLLPQDFGDTYMFYNEIQTAQGYDLAPYKGKEVMIYTYDVLNYPNQEKNVRINIIVFEDKVIGGDVSSIELDGFMHGFKKPQATIALTDG